MPVPALRLITLGLALGGIASTTPGCLLGQACTAAACGDYAIVRLDVPSATPSSFPLRVRICHNTDCRLADFNSRPVGDNIPSFASFSDEMATAPVAVLNSATGSLTPRAAGGVSLEIRWNSFDSTLARSGDRYTVDVSNVTGGPLAMLDKTATYTPYYPNGKDCGPTCSRATIE